MSMNNSQKYGLQIRIKSQKKLPSSLSLFREDDEEDYNVEKEISRQASKKSLKETGEQLKKALEQDPLALSYDEVYDDMKHKAVLPRKLDSVDRKPKYIAGLMKQAERRKKESEIVYTRKMAKEIEKDAHLFQDKPRFITSGYKRKLEAEKKWLEEERLREEREDVTKKKDLSEFYFNIGNNVALGAPDTRARMAEKALEEQRKAKTMLEEQRKAEKKTYSLEKKLVLPESRGLGSTHRPSVEASEKDSNDVARASNKRIRIEDTMSTEERIAFYTERLLARKMARENASG